MTGRSPILTAFALTALAGANVFAARTHAADLATMPSASRPARSAERTAGGDWPPPARLVSWAAAARPRDAKHLRILAINDFHGNLERPSIASARPAGGAAVLAAYLTAAEREAPDRTLIVHAGDQLGASPPITRLNGNEPAIEFLNLLANG
ncbi:MAG TPA: hypothetical protein VEV18_02630, partial [Steroidobacteraceae bacterium]|nr:hypothetical protein [Steroidobacteraceae bacterium]